MKKWIKLLLVAMLTMGLLIVAAGCGGQDAETPETAQPEAADKNVEKPVLQVASETTYPPFEMVDKDNGEYIGFDMDLIRAIGEAQGYDIEIKSMGFDSLIPAVTSGNVDCAISCISITEDRAKIVDFSEPYFQGGLVIAVQEDTEGISSREDLVGKKLAAEVATTGAAASQAIKDAEVKIFDGIGEAFMELEKGGADAVINDYPVTAYYIQQAGKGKVKMVGEVFSADEQYGMAIKKGNTEILNLLNEGLEKIKANGEYDTIVEKWFGK